jgi:hypothetical protein
MAKPFNFSPYTISGDFEMLPGKYNVIYADISSPSNLRLPDVSQCLNGSPVFIHNRGSATLTVISFDGFTSYTLDTNYVLFLTTKALDDTWDVLLGPLLTTGSGGGGISGPGSSTNNGLVLWNGTSGNVVKNSTVTFDGSTLNMNGASISGLSGITGFGGNYRSLFGVKTAISGLTTTDILSIPIVVGTTNNIVLQTLIVNEDNMSDSASITLNVKVKNILGAISSDIYGTFTMFDSTLTSAEVSFASSGNDFIVRGSGVAGVNTSYRTTAIVNSMLF